MFDFIRTHQRLMQFVLLLIIFPSFVVGGVVGFNSFSGSRAEIAKVGSEGVPVEEFNQALRSQIDRMKQAYGPDFDAQLLNTPEMRKEILDGLISRRVVALEAKQSKLAVTDEALQKNILEIPGLRKPDNSFDKDRYKSLLAAQGMTPASYEVSLRQDLTNQQLIDAIQGTAIMPKAIAARIAAISEQEREVQSLGFKAKDYLNEVKVTDEMMRAFYDKNGSQFEVPESVSVEYVVLSAESLAEKTTVSDTEVAAYYEQNKNRYSTEELRQASHILLSVAKDASEADKKAVQTKAEGLLAQLRKDPSLFPKLAKENSQDPGSAQNGGDLGFFKRGAMTKAFDETVFKLKQGEMSGLVTTEYGIHIVQLNAIKAAAVKPLDEVRGELVAEIKKQKASKAFAEAADTFTNLVEQSDSLQAVAEKMNLKLEKASNLGRQANPILPPTVASNNPKFLKAVFADEAIKKKHNIDPTELAPNTLFSARVLEHKPKSKRAFDEVKASIQTQLVQVEAQSLAKKAGLAKIAALKSSDSTNGFNDLKLVSRTKQSEIAPEALQAVLKADVQKLPAFVGVEVPGVGYEVFRIAKVLPGTPDPTRRANEGRQLENAIAQQEVFSYIEALKQRAKVTVNQSALNSKNVGDASSQ
ncbi:SurA N-terminal domain-containing protein [Undibacterium cyanobacteriorum]|uniref:Periplasmic chaperone PpiD n=1 Tax=Undibacterium cyanobacteriorum TaxID=3073561 RepID=A0ABY9RPS9_9BURK|nr:SurA N-terminal domain-containing protein [Undibacterium sp. 20NA77.5]WMW82270.1 SurA N-terminal domain-containing protein [Undibacterium sp. 20NA77.5]